MANTQVRGNQLKDGDVARDDLNTTTAGKAVVRKIVQGTGISLSSTGADAGTGDVTINAEAGAPTGWIPISVNPSYISPTVMYIAGLNLVSELTPGTKVKVTNGGTIKYFYVYGASFGTGTSVGFIPSNDYALVNSAITDFHYAIVERPYGFPIKHFYTPEWLSYATPQPAKGNGTLIGAYSINAGIVYAEITLVAGSTTTFGNNLWYFRYPVVKGDGGGGLLTGMVGVYDASSYYRYIGLLVCTNSTQLIINNPGTTAWYTSTVPITWAVGDTLEIKFQYYL
jgi:hypothetical protein